MKLDGATAPLAPRPRPPARTPRRRSTPRLRRAQRPLSRLTGSKPPRAGSRGARDACCSRLAGGVPAFALTVGNTDPIAVSPHSTASLEDVHSRPAAATVRRMAKLNAMVVVLVLVACASGRCDGACSSKAPADAVSPAASKRPGLSGVWGSRADESGLSVQQERFCITTGRNGRHPTARRRRRCTRWPAARPTTCGPSANRSRCTGTASAGRKSRTPPINKRRF